MNILIAKSTAMNRTINIDEELSYAPIIGHPQAGVSGQIQFCMGTYMGICTIILPTRKGKSVSFCLVMFYTSRGKQGSL